MPHWSRNTLRTRIRASRARASEQPGGTVRILLNADKATMSRWREAAQRSDRDLLEWIVAALDQAASVVEEREGDRATGIPVGSN